MGRRPLSIDGSRGEGGGQVLRSALALSLATGQACVVERIRAGRRRPGLARQHLAAVEMARRVGGARVEGAELGSQRLVFEPSALVPGRHEVEVGTAGSACLVAQAVLPALLGAGAPTTIVVGGGTHTDFAPPFEFLRDAWLPLLHRTGASVEARMERAGFFPAGGGRIVLDVTPAAATRPLDLREAGARRDVRAVALLARLPQHVGERELAVVARKLRWPSSALALERVQPTSGPGNALVLTVEHEHVTEVFVGYGRQGRPAETVAAEACEAARRWMRADVPVGPWLADQLMLPLALGGGGVYRTGAPSLHARTNAEVIHAFLGERIRFEEAGRAAVDVHVEPTATG